MADPPPSPVFWKNIKAKELREGVCEECENKGFRGWEREDAEAREGKEAKESMTEEESDDSFEGMPCLVQYFWCDMWSTLVLVFFY